MRVNTPLFTHMWVCKMRKFHTWGSQIGVWISVSLIQYLFGTPSGEISLSRI